MEGREVFRCRGGSTDLGTVPAFTLDAGEIVCLHVLRYFEPGAEGRLVTALNGMRDAGPAATLAEPTTATPGAALTNRTLDGLAAATTRSPVVVFSTAGLDPLGVRTVCDYARRHLASHSFIHLSYSAASAEHCCPLARCVKT